MTADKFSNKAEAFEAFDDTPLSPQAGETIGAIIARRYSRRDMLKGSLGVTAATVLFGEVALIGASGPAKAASAGFAFREVTAEVDEKHRVADGYDADIVIAWGDPLFAGPRALRCQDAHRRGPGQALRLQQRLHRFLPAQPAGHARAVVRQSRVCEPGGDVCRHRRPPGPQRLCQDHGRACRYRDGRARGRHRRDCAHRRPLAAGDRQPPQSPHHGSDGDDRRRARRRARSARDQGRSPGAQDPGHAQQLCRRPDAVGHLPHRRGEFPRLFLDRREGRRRQAQEEGPRRAAAEELRALRRARQLVQLGPPS